MKDCPFCGSDNISHSEVLSELESKFTVAQSQCQCCGALGPYAFVRGADYGGDRSEKAWDMRPEDGDAIAARGIFSGLRSP